MAQEMQLRHCAYCIKETWNTTIKSMSATLTMKRLTLITTQHLGVDGVCIGTLKITGVLVLCPKLQSHGQPYDMEFDCSRSNNLGTSKGSPKKLGHPLYKQ